MRSRLSPSIRRVLVVAALAAVATAQPAAAQPARPAPPPAATPGLADRELMVLNKSQHTVNELYVSPSNADQWGEDRLGDAMIAPGKSFRAKLGRTRDCEFDVQVVYDDASHEESRKFNLCRARQVTFDGTNAVAARPAEGPPHEVTLLNGSARPIQQVFISPADSTQWGDDRLGDDSISVGDRGTIQYRGECQADLRVIFDNKGAEERRGVDICEIPVISVEPGWTTADTLTTPAPSAPPASPPPPAPVAPRPAPPPAAPVRPVAPVAPPRPGAPPPAAPAPSTPPAPAPPIAPRPAPTVPPVQQRTQTPAAPAPAPSFTVRNRSGQGVAELYVFREGSADRGRDLLGLDTLADGGQVTRPLAASGGCKYAAHVVFDGKAPDQDIAGLDLCQAPEIVLNPR